jgi:hypothetical protein
VAGLAISTKGVIDMFALIVPLGGPFPSQLPMPGGPYPDQGLPGGYPGHHPGHPDQGLPGQGGHPSHPIALPPGVAWPPAPAHPIIPADPQPGTIWPPLPPGQGPSGKVAVAIWVSGLGVRYAVIELPQPK